MNLREKLSGRLSKNDVLGLAKQMGDDDMKEELYQLTLDCNCRVAQQALWVFQHFGDADNEWLYARHDELIDRVIGEKNETMCRLILNLLMRQPFHEDSLRADFLDFCLGNITACSQPYAIRALCMKLAYEQCSFFPELLDELKETLDMLAQEPLSPGVSSAKQQIMQKIKKCRKKIRD